MSKMMDTEGAELPAGVTITRCPPGAAGDALQPGRWPGVNAPAQELGDVNGTPFHRKASTGTRRPPIRPDMARREVEDGS